jgi:hypothetical protein
MMRRALAITLLSLFGWMLIAPLLAQNPDAGLPPCCRRHGKHHCSMMEPLTGHRRGVQTVQEKCPFSRNAKAVAHTSGYRPAMSAPLFAVALGPLVGAPQHESLCRLALDRSRLKRGPPVY